MNPTYLLRSSTSTSASFKAATASSVKTIRAPAPTIKDYAYFLPFQTRWGDNDSYVHLNNVMYNAYGDSIVNEYLSRSFPLLLLLLLQQQSALKKPRTYQNCTVNHLKLRLPSSSSSSSSTSTSSTSSSSSSQKEEQVTPVGLMVNSTFSFASPITYPSPLLSALSVSNVTRSSITWQVAIFSARYIKESLKPTIFSKEEIEKGQFKNFGREIELIEKVQHEQKASAWGSMTHVFVDEKTRKAVELPSEWRSKIEELRRDW